MLEEIFQIPSVIVKLSWIIFASGARQLVVQEALETTLCLGSYLSLLTPMTNIGASADGADMMTFLAPPETMKMRSFPDRLYDDYQTDVQMLQQQW